MLWRIYCGDAVVMLQQLALITGECQLLLLVQ